MNIQAIGSIMPDKEISEISQHAGIAGGGNNNNASSFSNLLEKSIGDVNQLLAQSDQKTVDLATGKSENLHDAMIAYEKAETAFKLLMQVRNRAIEAYHEVMRMQV